MHIIPVFLLTDQMRGWSSDKNRQMEWVRKTMGTDTEVRLSPGNIALNY